MLRINNQAQCCQIPVHSWCATGLEFKSGKGSRKRKQPIDLIVVHWTGGEGSVKTMFKTLQKRGYGVEFAINSDGSIYQFCDPCFVDTFDAGIVNRRSIGIEIVNYGYRTSKTKIPKLGKKRGTYPCFFRNKEKHFGKFYNSQMLSLVALCDALVACPDLKIKKAIPRNDYDIISKTMTQQELKKFSGVLGHFHVSDKKIDPGMQPFDILECFGY